MWPQQTSKANTKETHTLSPGFHRVPWPTAAWGALCSVEVQCSTAMEQAKLCIMKANRPHLGRGGLWIHQVFQRALPRLLELFGDFSFLNFRVSSSGYNGVIKSCSVVWVVLVSLWWDSLQDLECFMNLLFARFFLPCFGRCLLFWIPDKRYQTFMESCRPKWF